MPDGTLPALFPSDGADGQSTPALDDPLWAEDEAEGLRAASGIALSTSISAVIWLGLAVAFNWFFGR